MLFSLERREARIYLGASLKTKCQHEEEVRTERGGLMFLVNYPRLLTQDALLTLSPSGVSA